MSRVEEMQDGGDAGWGRCRVEEMQNGGDAGWRRCRMGEMQGGGDAGWRQAPPVHFSYVRAQDWGGRDLPLLCRVKEAKLA